MELDFAKSEHRRVSGEVVRFTLRADGGSTERLRSSQSDVLLHHARTTWHMDEPRVQTIVACNETATDPVTCQGSSLGPAGESGPHEEDLFRAHDWVGHAPFTIAILRGNVREVE